MSSWYLKQFVYSWVYNPIVPAAVVGVIATSGLYLQSTGKFPSGSRALASSGLWIVAALCFIVFTGYGVLFLVGSGAAVIAYSAIVAMRRQGLYQETTASPTPTAVFSVWLSAGLFVLFLFPYGSIIHEYYFWWSIVPAAGLIGSLVEIDAAPPRTTKLLKYAAVFLIFWSCFLTLIHATRAYDSLWTTSPVEQLKQIICFWSNYQC